MAALEEKRAGVGVALGGALALFVGLSSCKSVSQAPPNTTALPPQTLVSAPTAEAAAGVAAAPTEEARRPPAPEPARPAEEKPQTLIVIEPAEAPDAEPSQDLASAARREKERRRDSQKPIAVIDQKNLASWAAGGVLTQAAEPEEPSAVETAAAEVVEKAAIEEAYWRRRGREIRQRWHDADDRIAVLEAKSDSLRNRFYTTDDGYLRDSQIKPEWDKAIADLEEARYQTSRGAAEVLAFLEEGRRAGALPGWLRDGVELEPEPVVESAPEGASSLEAKEPEIYRDPAAADESRSGSEQEPTQENEEPPPGGGVPRQ